MKLVRYIPLILVLTCIFLWLLTYLCLASECPLTVHIDTNLLLPLALYAVCALLPALLILFSPHRVFIIWCWFALAWTTLSFLLVAGTPVSISGFFTTLPWTRSLTALGTGACFGLTSTALILVLSARSSEQR